MAEQTECKPQNDDKGTTHTEFLWLEWEISIIQRM